MKFYIKEAREMAGYTQKEMVAIVGVAPNTFHGYESGKHDPKSYLLKQIAAACHVSVDFLLTGKEPIQKKASPLSGEAMELASQFSLLDSYGKRAVRAVLDEELVRVRETRNSTRVELFPVREYIQAASAGYGDFADDDSYNVVDLKKRPPAGTTYLIHVNGDSMEPTYHDGDRLFVSAQETLRHGEIGVFSINGDLYVKEFGSEGLISHNPDFPVKVPGPFDNFTTLGKVLGVCTDDYLQNN